MPGNPLLIDPIAKAKFRAQRPLLIANVRCVNCNVRSVER